MNKRSKQGRSKKSVRTDSKIVRKMIESLKEQYIMIIKIEEVEKIIKQKRKQRREYEKI